MNVEHDFGEIHLMHIVKRINNKIDDGGRRSI